MRSTNISHLLLFELSFLLILLIEITGCSPPETRLLKDLIHDYNPLERPVERSEDAVVVQLGVSLQQIINLSEREEKLEVNAWLKYAWTDMKLRWNPVDYENVTDLRHPAGTIWQPDILLYNSVDSTFDSTFKVNAITSHDGSVSWIPPGIFKVSCKIDIYWFPFDEQTCYFKFGSWSFSGKGIDLQPGEFDLSEFIENGQWVVVRTWNQRYDKYYDCCTEPYPDVKFFIHLRRRVLYYSFNFIMPCTLTLILVVLGFTLSPDTCEKVGLQISLALAICIFLTIMNEMTPRTSEAVPLLGIFFQSCMVISVAATAFTVYAQVVHFRNPDTNRRMGFWMRYLLLEWFALLLKMKHPKRVNNLKTLKQSWKERKNRSKDDRTAFSYDDDLPKIFKKIGEALHENFNRLIFHVQIDSVTKDDDHLKQRLKILDRIHSHVKSIRERSDEEIEIKRIGNEWRFAALVVDRLGLLIFTFIIAITSIVIFIRAPYFIA